MPFIWKVDSVIPVYKKGSKEILSSYKPISLTCNMLEHVVSSMIHKLLNSYNNLHDSQHSFRKERSCDSQLVYTINKLALNLDKKNRY